MEEIGLKETIGITLQKGKFPITTKKISTTLQKDSVVQCSLITIATRKNGFTRS